MVGPRNISAILDRGIVELGVEFKMVIISSANSAGSFDLFQLLGSIAVRQGPQFAEPCRRKSGAWFCTPPGLFSGWRRGFTHRDLPRRFILAFGEIPHDSNFGTQVTLFFSLLQEPKILKEALRLGLPYVDVCDWDASIVFQTFSTPVSAICIDGRTHKAYLSVISSTVDFLQLWARTVGRHRQRLASGDDTDLCTVAKDLSTDAERCGVPAVVSAGIWPGVSALMVCEARERLGDIEEIGTFGWEKRVGV